LSYVQDRRWRSRVLKLEISSSDEASSNVPKVNPVLPALVARGAVSHIVPFTDPTDPRTSGVPAVKNPRLRLLEAAQRADWSEFAGFLHEASNPVGDCMFVLETIVSREEWWKAVQVFLRLRRLGIQPNLKAHNLMLKTYAALGLPQQAYNQYQAMKASAGVRPNNESFEHLLCVMTFCEDLDGGKMVLEILQDYNGLGIPFRPEVYKRALRVCGHLRDLESGEKALELLAARGLSPNLAIYNQMIYMYGACAEWERAVQTAEEMKSQGFYPNAMTYFALIVACGDSLGLEQALRLFDSMKLSGPVPKECYSGAIRVCCNANDHAKARALLDEMKNENDARGGRCAPSRIDYDYVLRCCASNAEAWREALDLLRTMRNDGITPESRTYVVLMDTLRKVKRPAKALEVFYRMRKQGTINIHPKCFSAAICAASEQDKPKLALSLLEEAKINGAATSSVYAAAINACANAKDYLTACDLLDEMQQKEVPMTVEAVGAAIKACYEAGLWRQAVKLLELLTTKKVPGDTLQCFNTAISACAKASRWKEALSLLEIIKKHNQSGPDIFSYSSVITACARADKFEKVQELVQEMEQKQLPGNLITYNALASAHRKKGDYRSIFRIMKEMRHFGIQPDDRTYMEAILACNKAGQYGKAMTTWTELQESGIWINHQAYGAAMRAMGQLRLWRAVISTIKQMKERGIKPNSIEYLSAIHACKKSKRWDAAILILQQMRNDGLKPCIKSYTSTITVCVQAGQHEEAYILFRRMAEDGVQPNEVTYSIMILGCRMGGKWERAVGLIHEMAEDGQVPSISCFKYGFEALEEAGKWSELLEQIEYARKLGVSLGHMGTVFEITAQGKLGNDKAALDILEDQFKAQGKLAPEMVESTVQALVCAGKIKEAFNLLSRTENQLGCLPRAQAYTFLLKHALHKVEDLAETEKLYHQVLADMQGKAIRPLRETYNLQLSILNKLDKPEEVDEVYLEALQNGRLNPWGRFDHGSIFLVQFEPEIAVHALKRTLLDMKNSDKIETGRRCHSCEDNLLIICGMPQKWQTPENADGYMEMKDRDRLQVLSTAIKFQFKDFLYGVTVDEKHMAIIITSQALKAWVAVQNSNNDDKNLSGNFQK